MSEFDETFTPDQIRAAEKRAEALRREAGAVDTQEAPEAREAAPKGRRGRGSETA